MSNASDTPKTTTVRIYAPHTHAGQRIVPPAEGTDLQVTEKQAAFLKARGLTERPAAVAEASVAVAKTPAATPTSVDKTA